MRAQGRGGMQMRAAQGCVTLRGQRWKHNDDGGRELRRQRLKNPRLYSHRLDVEKRASHAGDWDCGEPLPDQLRIDEPASGEDRANNGRGEGLHGGDEEANVGEIQHQLRRKYGLRPGEILDEGVAAQQVERVGR